MSYVLVLVFLYHNHYYQINNHKLTAFAPSMTVCMNRDVVISRTTSGPMITDHLAGSYLQCPALMIESKTSSYQQTDQSWVGVLKGGVGQTSINEERKTGRGINSPASYLKTNHLFNFPPSVCSSFPQRQMMKKEEVWKKCT